MIEIRSQGQTHRIHVMRGMFNKSGLGLEIGPSFRPVAAKSEGFNVKIVDHATADDLRQKYQGKAKAAVDRIEDVDHVWQGGSLVETIGEAGRFDYVIASHVIEHTTDIIRFLRDCESLLKSDGALVLAVPDKRYCFDFFRPVSTLGEALQAYMEKRDRHSIATLFDHNNLLAKNGTLGAWSKTTPPDDVRLLFDTNSAMVRTESALSSPLYTDAHAWQFTPSSFLFLLADLRRLGLISLYETEMVDGTNCEFFVRLQKGGTALPTDRLELARAMLKEQAESLLSWLAK